MNVEIIDIYSDGTIKIPDSMLEELRLSDGDQVGFYVFNQEIIMKPIRKVEADA